MANECFPTDPPWSQNLQARSKRRPKRRRSRCGAPRTWMQTPSRDCLRNSVIPRHMKPCASAFTPSPLPPRICLSLPQTRPANPSAGFRPTRHNSSSPDPRRDRRCHRIHRRAPQRHRPLLVAAAERWAKSIRAPAIVVRSNVQRTGSHAFYPALNFSATKTQNVYRKSLPGEVGP